MTCAKDSAPPFYHATRADLSVGDLLASGHASNYGTCKVSDVGSVPPLAAVALEILARSQRLVEAGRVEFAPSGAGGTSRRAGDGGEPRRRDWRAAFRAIDGAGLQPDFAAFQTEPMARSARSPVDRRMVTTAKTNDLEAGLHGGRLEERWKAGNAGQTSCRTATGDAHSPVGLGIPSFA